MLNFLHLIELGVGVGTFLSTMTLFLPYLIFIILPIICVLSTINIYKTLKEQNQLIILQASGLTHYALIKPALILGMIVTCCAYYISFIVIPSSHHLLKNRLEFFRENYISSTIEPQTFNAISKQSTLYIEQKLENNHMQGVIFFDMHNISRPIIFVAKAGEVIFNEDMQIYFKLRDGVRQEINPKGELVSLSFDEMLLTITTAATQSSERTKVHLEMPVTQLLRPDAYMPEKLRRQFITEGHMRIIWPLFNIVLVLLANSIFIAFPTSRNKSLKPYFYISTITGLCLYCHFVTQKLSYKDLWYVKISYVNLALFTILPVLILYLKKRRI
jgi:lipopolysaccharide export system permease protein